jgi:hypothetical protein
MELGNGLEEIVNVSLNRTIIEWKERGCRGKTVMNTDSSFSEVAYGSDMVR